MLPANELHRARKKHKDPRSPSGYETSDTVVSDGDRDRYGTGSANERSMPRNYGRGAQSDNELTARDLAIIAAQRQRHALQHQQYQQQQEVSPALQVPRASRPHRHSSGLSGSFSALALSQEDAAASALRKPALGPPRHSMFEMGGHEDPLNKDKVSRTQQRMQHSRDLPMLPVLNHSSHAVAHAPASAEQVLNLPLNSSSAARALHIGHNGGNNSHVYNYNSVANGLQHQPQQMQQQQQYLVSSRHQRKFSNVSMSEDETLSRASSDPLSPGPSDPAGRRPSGGTGSSNMPRLAVRNLPPLPAQLSALSPRPNGHTNSLSPAPVPYSPYSHAFDRERSEVSSPLPPSDQGFPRPLPVVRQQSRVNYNTEPEADYSDRSDVCGNPNCHCSPSPRPHPHAASPQLPYPSPNLHPQHPQFPHHPRGPFTPQQHPGHQQFTPSPPPPQQGQGVLFGIDTPPPLPPRQMQPGARQRSGSVVSAVASDVAPPLSPHPNDQTVPNAAQETMGMSTTDWMQLLKNYRTKASETVVAPATAAS